MNSMLYLFRIFGEAPKMELFHAIHVLKAWVEVKTGQPRVSFTTSEMLGNLVETTSLTV